MKIEMHPRATELSAIPEATRQAERLGYDGVTSNETNHEAFLPIVLMAEHSERLEVGTSIAISFPRSPMIVANLAWDLQKFSRGRFNLGLGTQVKGHNQRRFSVPWSPPAPRMREYVQALRAIWDCWQNGTKLDFTGEHYTFTLMTPMFDPGPIEHPKIPIYLAAVGDAMCRLVGEVADGIRLHTFNTPKYVQQVILPSIEAGAKRAGRSMSDLEIIGGSFIVTGA
ncbi:MAG TPA: TIGR03617 family F420-dependent LLM class oxidoreductase, partial [Dehalococcoidia bacterium]|nr:TIGR03617 family F420-dependent LLM class oxidoreductase [Dehalococcoidia bacterium]